VTGGYDGSMIGSVWRCRDHELELGPRTLVMGIVNVTPDSFSDGGMLSGSDEAVAHGTHERFIVDVQKVRERLLKKARRS